MQINQLPVIPQAPANDDVLAIEVNGITYKVSKSALASAILGTIDTTPTQSSTQLVQSGGVYTAIQQSTAWANNWIGVPILEYAASVANPSFTSFRTSATSTDVPISNEYYIGTVERYGQNISVKMTTMQDASKLYINNSTNGGSTWSGWKTFVDYAQSTANSAKSAFTSWGTTLTATSFHHGLLLASASAAYIVWFSATNNIIIRSLRTGSVSKESNDNTITFGADSADGTDFTITRSGNTITVTSTGTTTLSLIYN